MTVFSQQRGDLNVEGQNISVEFVASRIGHRGTQRCGFSSLPGSVFQPQSQPVRTAFIAAHYNVDFSEHYLAPLMAAGFRVPGLEYPVSW
ncbi:MAG: hypothetical protein CM15mP120_28910 [Pseudomonadota bacterium]|nr:MAG: hypothetical protein CM15mP120_28910 [Pseudomonadota bacterium]